MILQEEFKEVRREGSKGETTSLGGLISELRIGDHFLSTVADLLLSSPILRF